jgi:hypothetical protein
LADQHCKSEWILKAAWPFSFSVAEFAPPGRRAGLIVETTSFSDLATSTI